MLDLLVTILFIWLFVKVLKLIFHVAWGTAKILASILLAIACPLLVFALTFAGGVILLLPVALIGIAFGILKKCI